MKFAGSGGVKYRWDFGDGAPWKWISVGNPGAPGLEGLRSFTILGWLNASSLKTGSGGNRIAFNLERFS